MPQIGSKRGFVAGEAPHREKSLLGNKGNRRYHQLDGSRSLPDHDAKIGDPDRYDGKWVLRTNTDLNPAEVELQYKRQWMVEPRFHSTQFAVPDPDVLSQVRRNDPRVTCSARSCRLVLRQKLEVRLDKHVHDFEWADVIQDLDRLQMVEVERHDKHFSCGTSSSADLA